MNVNFDAPKPEIKVFYAKDCVPEKVVLQILLGIEEEGVLFTVEEKPTKVATKLAVKAAEASHLGVGIGICESAVIHYIKLKEGEPLFRVSVNSDEETLRSLGSNAARLVKRMPFKELG